MTAGNNDEPFVPSGAIVSPIPVPGMIDPAGLTRTLNAQQKLSQAQSRADSTDKALRELNAGTDPDYVQTDDRFEAWSHQAIYDAVNGLGGMDVNGLQTLRKAWFDAYSELANLSTFNQLGVNRVLSHGAWAGASGDAAREASATFGKAANQVAQVFSAMADRMDAVAWAAEATRTAVPAPVSASNTLNPDDPLSSIIPGLANPETVTQSREQAEEARLAVVAAMNQIYKPSFPPSGSGVPSYTNVASVLTTGDTPVTGTSGAGSGINGGSGSPSAATPSGAGAPATDIPTGSATEALASTPTDPASSNGDTTSAASMVPTTTTPTTTNPVVSAPAAQTSPSGLAAGQAGVGGLGVARPVSGLGGRQGTPSPGKSVAGPSANPGGSSGLGAGTTPGARAGGAGAFGPMMPGGASRRKEDDAEHQTPEYLRRVHADWTAGISTSNGVIGSDGLPPVSCPDPGPPAVPAPSAPMPVSREVPTVAPPAAAPPDESPASAPPASTSGGQAAEMARLIAQYGWANGSQGAPAIPASQDDRTK
ncbi:hypothetical protein [Nocardia mangyaensis]|uniref:hypothetical protein n=1 Tax=Nocardia mangyaensis TaxID=2213200 RepID=UPI002675B319|nr:hypothetical protein [Nocardia mangyaensis]MDO3645676.1 hypothetical protein [Nocardia mangyaensis]